MTRHPALHSCLLLHLQHLQYFSVAEVCCCGNTPSDFVHAVNSFCCFWLQLQLFERMSCRWDPSEPGYCYLKVAAAAGRRWDAGGPKSAEVRAAPVAAGDSPQVCSGFIEHSQCKMVPE